MTRRRPIRICIRCGVPGKFSKPGAKQKICDVCRADPQSKVKYESDKKIRWSRARHAATRRLIERHHDEYRMLWAEERAALGDEGWPGVTLREVDDFERRKAEAIAAGWRKG